MSLLFPCAPWRRPGLILLIALLTLAGCAPRGYRLDRSHPARSQDDRVTLLVLHYTADDYDRSLTTLTRGPVSAHYLVPAPRDGRAPTVLQLVDESRRAWHAGESYWRGRTHLNDTSIGIELENDGYRRDADGTLRWAPWPPQQIAVVTALCRDILRRHAITPFNVVGHSDIAWRRKQDPGPLFPWQQLAAAGVGVWPQAARVNYFLAGRDPQAPAAAAPILRGMAQLGYDVTPDMPQALQRRALRAFQMHYRPRDYRGLPDAETDAVLRALLEIDTGAHGGV
ncbi:N-acetylmuramoyl-L-alanine amidase [Candidatus Sodalis sp. SoCistrobi]|uniref:N-acetylmuramoyl-L-alanine amidase n=1 Tax=Candidatus Sodalis sp. SoCistrobi TaxID=1922216 RepID=UPI00093D9FE1|nr:N-acetylmuramoyl-L-alanine amidase [Candidatus Sodalis sp. SoCistrobi]